MDASRHIRTDERFDALKSLEMVVESLRRVVVDPYRWKWAILAMQNAVQAFIVVTISGTAGLGALRPGNEKKWLEAFESGTGDFPEEMKIDCFPALYDRMKKKFSYTPDPTVDDSVKKVNWLRNEFVHFPPHSWSIGTGGLPRIFKDCLGVVGYPSQSPISGKTGFRRDLDERIPVECRGAASRTGWLKSAGSW